MESLIQVCVCRSVAVEVSTSKLLMSLLLGLIQSENRYSVSIRFVFITPSA